MKDYSNYRKYIQKDMITYSGNFHFQQQLNQEGSYVTVNFKEYFNEDTKEKYRMIIRNTTNENKENLEERTIMAYKEYGLKTGDIIQYLNEYFIITTHIDMDNPFFNTCKMSRCDKIVTWNVNGKDIICPTSSSSISSYQSNVNDNLVNLNELSTIKLKLSVSLNIEEYKSIPNWIHFTNLYPESRFWITQRVDGNTDGIMEVICIKDIFNESIELLQYVDDVEDEYGITRNGWKVTRNDIMGNMNHIVSKEIDKEWGYNIEVSDVLYTEEIKDIQESSIIRFDNKLYDVIKIVRCKNSNPTLDSYYKIGLLEKEDQNIKIIESGDNNGL